MATPNYSYEKRQRELANKRKTEEKRQRKVNKPDGEAEGVEGAEPAEGEAPVEGTAPPTAA